mmetsp:Transcript_39575/g.95033  ORF Transcript_39575/g.95033 Transcript_39575/m.95033 type:complete len:290 (-) Transcript_39575:3165-4034(-)
MGSAWQIVLETLDESVLGADLEKDPDHPELPLDPVLRVHAVQLQGLLRPVHEVLRPRMQVALHQVVLLTPHHEIPGAARGHLHGVPVVRDLPILLRPVHGDRLLALVVDRAGGEVDGALVQAHGAVADLVVPGDLVRPGHLVVGVPPRRHQVGSLATQQRPVVQRLGRPEIARRHPDLRRHHVQLLLAEGQHIHGLLPAHSLAAWRRGQGPPPGPVPLRVGSRQQLRRVQLRASHISGPHGRGRRQHLRQRRVLRSHRVQDAPHEQAAVRAGVDHVALRRVLRAVDGVL